MASEFSEGMVVVEGAPDGAVLVLPGIDGTTPLGFLAALGLLRVLDDASSPDLRSPRLSWRQLDTWRPLVYGTNSIELLAQLVFADVVRGADLPILKFRYVKQEKQGPKLVGGLKPPLGVVRAWARARREEYDEGSLVQAAGLFCQDVTEVNKQPASLEDYRSAGVEIDDAVALEHSVERSFFDFTSRNAQFLEQVEKIREHLNIAKIRSALENGAFDYEAPRKLDWDPAADTPAAIYTGFRRGYLPVHEWLGFRALGSFPLAGVHSAVRMTGCTGRRLAGEFSWPLWEGPASIRAISSILGYPDLRKLDLHSRRAFGISEILAAGLTKQVDGYTGTFTPGRPV